MYFDWLAKIRALETDKGSTTFFGIIKDIASVTVGEEDGPQLLVSTVKLPRTTATLASTPYDKIGKNRARVSTTSGNVDIPF